jgi:hypothetical protein
MKATECEEQARKAETAAETKVGMEKLNMLRVAAQWRAMASRLQGGGIARSPSRRSD